MKKVEGFTLVELMVTVVVMVVVLAVGIPMFRSIIASNRLAAQTNTLVTALNLARGEALKRVSTVSLCKKGAGVSCSTDDNDWGSGLLVFEDLNGDGALDSGEEVIRVWDAVSGNPAISAVDASDDSGVTAVSFDPMGIQAAARTVTFDIPNPDGKGCTSGTKTAVITLSPTGQVSSGIVCK